MESGDNICKETLNDPADSPNRVTDSGSPPKSAMLFLTQVKAKCWSLRPAFPGTLSVPNERKPRGLRKHSCAYPVGNPVGNPAGNHMGNPVGNLALLVTLLGILLETRLLIMLKYVENPVANHVKIQFISLLISLLRNPVGQ